MNCQRRGRDKFCSKSELEGHIKLLCKSILNCYILKKKNVKSMVSENKGQFLQPFIFPHSFAVFFLWKTHALLWTGLIVLWILKVTPSFFSKINKHRLEAKSRLSVPDDSQYFKGHQINIVKSFNVYKIT